MLVRAARLYNEIASENSVIQCEKWYEKREKGSEKPPETSPKKTLRPSLAALKYLTGTSLK